MVNTGLSAVAGYALTPDLLHVVFTQCQHVLPVEDDASFRNLARVWHQPQDGPPGHRLAAAGLTHQAKDLTSLDLEADALNGMYITGWGPKTYLQVLDS
jgi:hypothetical protein